MRFLSPLALLGLALVTLPVVIHLLVRRRAGRLDFPSLRFLRETPSFRLRLRRLQQPLLLALRVAALLLLIFGLARPLLTFSSGNKPTRVILIDASLSMKASGRAEAARQQAQAIINQLAAGERAALIAFSSEATQLAPTTADRRELLTAVERYQPTAGATSFAAGFAAAAAALKREPPADSVIHLISDFQESGLAPEPSASGELLKQAPGRVVTHAVGARVGRNAFLTDVEVAAVEAGTQLSATEIVTGADGTRSGSRRSWMLEGNEGSGAELEWRKAADGRVLARLRTVAPDDFDGDDERFLAFQEPRAGRALLIERDGDAAVLYLAAALEASRSDVGEQRLTLERKKELPPSAAELEGYSLIALGLGREPRAEELGVLADYARGGGFVWFCVGREVDTGAWNEFARMPEGGAWPFAGFERKDESARALNFGAADAGATALSFISEQVLDGLRAVRLREGFGVTPRENASVMLRWNDGAAALVGGVTGNGFVLLLGASPARSSGELGASTAFPALASAIARAALEPRKPSALVIGEPVNLGLAPDASVKITFADGSSRTVAARELLTRPASVIAEAGIYRFEADGLSRHLAFNAAAVESESALAAADAIKHRFERSSPMAQESASAWQEVAERRWPLWRYLLAGAFLLLISEVFIAARTRQSVEPETEVQDGERAG